MEITIDTGWARRIAMQTLTVRIGVCIVCMRVAYVGGICTYNSFGTVDAPSYGVRPVVSLDSDIQLELNSTQANTYDIK